MSRRPRSSPSAASPSAASPSAARRAAGKRASGRRWLARLLALPLLGWVLGFLWFSLALPGPAPLSARTDGVVVLTGGAGRFRRGLATVEAGAARRMLVSGVDRATSRKQLAAAYDLEVARLNTTDLGYAAIDTRSNAEETARWVQRHGFSSIRLVTSAGHMRRARLELARVLPAGVTVLPDAVPSEPKAPSLAFEYSKWLARRAALAVGAA